MMLDLTYSGLRREWWKFGHAIGLEGREAVQVTRGGAFRLGGVAGWKVALLWQVRIIGLWCSPVAGGEERQVLNSISGGNWTVGSRGIYYFDFPEEPGAPKPVKFYSFQSGKSTQIGTVEASVPDGYGGFSLSPDGHWLLYPDIVTKNSDLMLVDHFRGN